MTLPVRASVRVTRFAVRTGLTLSVRALTAAADAVTSLTGGGTNGASAWPAPQAPPSASEAADASVRVPVTEPAPPVTKPAPPVTKPTPPVTEPAPPVTEPAPPVDEEAAPAHVSEEPVLVEEFAEPGAEEGAGASVTVAEPWEGYAQMNARDITARLGDAPLAELAAVQLYESSHKQRETVLSAVERELRTKTAPGG